MPSYSYFLIACFVFCQWACNPGTQQPATSEAADTATNIVRNEPPPMPDVQVNADEMPESEVQTPPNGPSDPPKVKNPSGIYFTRLPYKDYEIAQTVAFYPNNTYRLQEKYSGANDSLVVVRGNWTPSNGYIWLYKDQVVRGRYKWKGDSLQYYNPATKAAYNMTPLKTVLENKVWQNKKREGAVLFGIGNEPFWSVQLNNNDSLSFQLADWSLPIKLKLNQRLTHADTIIYLAGNDSANIRLSVLPYFCNDGMSDVTYPNKILILYNQKSYSGCGMRYR